ncbi:mitochondrial carrier domain-containing protein [Chaetomium sp. MPI-SDFR-AT-0129]|nr:mitochondrial carrier domain-containing protein [Chaetomium sp. MPI-SDFR-AT-0129]
MPGTPNLLPALGHAASGAAGTVVSTAATYPLDLVNTRLKVQRQLARDGSMDAADAYEGVLDAFAAIYAREGGAKAFFAGLGADAAKSAWFRARRLAAHKSVPYLGVAEELAVGAAAGACAKLFTTPVSNVVTRRQTASLLDSSSSSSPSSTPTTTQPRTGKETEADEKTEPKSESESTSPTNLTLTQHLSALRRERGLRGLWAGYSASLVLTLNPSLTFFLQQALRRVLLSRGRGKQGGKNTDTDDLSAATTFFLAAASKVVATAVTYPFLVAKARMQVSTGADGKGGEGDEEEGKKKRGNIFATVWRIGKAEGVSALYDGISGELLKGFFSHGTTMLAKDVIHRFIVQVYMAVVALLLRNPQWVLPVVTTVGRVRQGLRKRVGNASSSGRKGARYVEDVMGAGKDKAVGLVGLVKSDN